VEALADAPGAMQEVLLAFVRTADQTTRTNRTVIDAGSQLAADSAEVASVTAAIGDRLSELASEVESMTSLIARLPNDLVAPAAVAKALAQDLESATPVALLFKESSEQMRVWLDALKVMASELKYAADQYRLVNEQHRQQSQ